MNPMFREFAIWLPVLTIFSLAGCGGAQTTAPKASVDQHEHEHEAHADDHDDAGPDSFSEAVQEVEELSGEIQTTLTAGDLDAAHGPLHEIGHLLGELSELAAKESLSEADQEQVRQAAESLMESFAALDERLHGGDSAGKSYDEVATEINESIAMLRTVTFSEDQP